MIRKCVESDSESIMQVWLEASVQAHTFLDRDFWSAKADDMRAKYLFDYESWVFQEGGRVLGFFSLSNDTLAALFVSPDCQGNGIGRGLIDKAKSLRKSLKLTVCSENARAVEYYKIQGFKPVKRRLDKQTGLKEVVMVYEDEAGADVGKRNHSH